MKNKHWNKKAHRSFTPLEKATDFNAVRSKSSETTAVPLARPVRNFISNGIKEQSSLTGFTIAIGKPRQCFFSLTGLIVIVVVLVFLSVGCSTGYNLATQKEEFLLLSSERETKMGQALAKQVEKKFDLEEDAALQTQVEEIGRKIAQACDRKTIEYHFKVLADEKEKNAFALPGGWVYIFKGLMNELKSDDEIAAVLAHEVGHIAARHSAKRWQTSIGYSALMVLASQAEAERGARAKMAEALGQLFLSYSREDEILADKLAVRYLRNAGYNPQAVLSALNTLKRIQQEKPLRRYQGAGTHPHLSERIGLVKKELFGKMDFKDYLNLSEEAK